MKRSAYDHLKIRKLARKLGIRKCFARGVIDSIWQFTAKYAPSGDIGRWSNEDIADDIDWPVDEMVTLVDALVEVRLLDVSADHRLVVHDWSDHAEDSVHAALIQDRLLFVDGSMPKIGRYNKDDRKVILEDYEKLKASRTGPHGADTLPHGAAREPNVAEREPDVPARAFPSLSSPSLKKEENTTPTPAAQPDPEPEQQHAQATSTPPSTYTEPASVPFTPQEPFDLSDPWGRMNTVWLEHNPTATRMPINVAWRRSNFNAAVKEHQLDLVLAGWRFYLRSQAGPFSRPDDVEGSVDEFLKPWIVAANVKAAETQRIESEESERLVAEGRAMAESRKNIKLADPSKIDEAIKKFRSKGFANNDRRQATNNAGVNITPAAKQSSGVA